MADNNKIVTLGNIAILKDYINKNIEKASKMLNDEYEAQFDILKNDITALKNLGTLDELAKLQLELDALNANFEDKKEALEILKTDFENLSNGITDGTVFSAGQLNEIIKTALIDETVITDEMVSTPNVFTQKIVALIGNFGKINAGQVEAGTLKGSNIESTNKIDYTNDPVWLLNNNGSGWLANKNIIWDEEGNVNFGPGVKLSWNSMDDDTIPDFATKEDLDSIEAGGMTDSEFKTKLTEIGPNWIETQYIDASKISGDTIEGKTIQSNTKGQLSDGTNNQPLWKINNDGSGHLAKGNIKWDKDGKVNFGSNVELSWGNITETDNIATSDSVTTSITNSLKGYATSDSVNTSINSAKTEINNTYSPKVTQIDANGIYTGSITANQITAGKISADRIDVDNLNVKQLNTDPKGNTDKIEIAENHLHCVNNEGQTNLIISSNPIDSYAVTEILNSSKQIDNNTRFSSEALFASSPDTETKIRITPDGTDLPPSSYAWENTSAGEVPQSIYNKLFKSSNSIALGDVTEVGYLYSGAEFDIRPYLTLYSIDNSETDPIWITGGVWSVVADLDIELYKYNMLSDSWEKKSDNTINSCATAAGDRTTLSLNRGNWVSTLNKTGENNQQIILEKLNLVGSKMAMGPNFIKASKKNVTFNIEENGRYGVKLVLNPIFTVDGHLIPYVFAMVPDNEYSKYKVLAGLKIDVKNNNVPKKYTEIGKDGIIVYDGNNILACYKDGVEMKSLISNNESFYGVKTCSDGLYVCNGGSSYVTLDSYIKNFVKDINTTE